MAATVGPDADRLTGDGRHALRGIGVALATLVACLVVIRLSVTSVAPDFAQTVIPADTFNLSSAVAGNRCNFILVLLGLGALFWSGLLMVATALSWSVRIIADVIAAPSDPGQTQSLLERAAALLEDPLTRTRFERRIEMSEDDRQRAANRQSISSGIP